MHHGAYCTGIDRHAHGRDVRSGSIGIEYHIEEVGAGSRRAEDIPAALDERDRAAAGFTAPAQGLILWDVRY